MFAERRLPAAVLCAAVMAALAGCSSSSDTTGGPGVVPVSPSPTSMSASPSPDDANLTFPIFAYMPAPDERVVVEQARHVVEGDCARSFGISWTAPPLPSAVGADHITARLWGVMTMADAQQTGYHFPAFMRAAEQTQRPSSDAENFVLYGALRQMLPPGTTPPTSSPGNVAGKPVPPSGCYGKSNQELFGSPGPPESPTMTAAQIWFSGGNAAAADPRVQALNKQWSACMSTKGHHYSDPFAANAGGWGSPESGNPSQHEIQTAVDDIECKTSTNYIPAANDIMRSINQKMMAPHMSDLKAGEKKWEKIVTRARAIVAASTAAQSTG